MINTGPLYMCQRTRFKLTLCLLMCHQLYSHTYTIFIFRVGVSPMFNKANRCVLMFFFSCNMQRSLLKEKIKLIFNTLVNQTQWYLPSLTVLFFPFSHNMTVAGPNRNRILFHCVFQAHHQVRCAIALSIL